MKAIAIIATCIIGLLVARKLSIKNKKQQGNFKVVFKERTKYDHFVRLAAPLRGTFEAKSIREKRLNNLASGNVGVAYVITEGHRIFIQATSKDKKPKELRYPRFNGLTEINLWKDRIHCTEFQILNYLDFLDLSRKIDCSTAKISLYTEHAPCDSCAEVINEFMEEHQNSNIEVMYRHPAGQNSTWPSITNGWKADVKNRLNEKCYPSFSISDLFTKGRRYAFIYDDQNVHKVFQYKGERMIENKTHSVWVKPPMNKIQSNLIEEEYFDIEFDPQLKSIHYLKRDNLNTLLDEVGNDGFFKRLS